MRAHVRVCVCAHARARACECTRSACIGVMACSPCRMSDTPSCLLCARLGRERKCPSHSKQRCDRQASTFQEATRGCTLSAGACVTAETCLAAAFEEASRQLQPCSAERGGSCQHLTTMSHLRPSAQPARGTQCDTRAPIRNRAHCTWCLLGVHALSMQPMWCTKEGVEHPSCYSPATSHTSSDDLD